MLECIIIDAEPAIRDIFSDFRTSVWSGYGNFQFLMTVITAPMTRHLEESILINVPRTFSQTITPLMTQDCDTQDCTEALDLSEGPRSFRSLSLGGLLPPEPTR